MSRIAGWLAYLKRNNYVISSNRCAYFAHVNTQNIEAALVKGLRVEPQRAVPRHSHRPHISERSFNKTRQDA